MTISKGSERPTAGAARPRTAVLLLIAAIGAWTSTIPATVEAQLGSRPADDWALILESGRRMATLDIENVVEEARFAPGESVADIGAGTGIFSVPIAEAVGPEGRVLAVEVDEGFMKFIEEKAAAEGLSNVETVLGTFEDPMLPSRDVDVAFFHDVLHHIADRPGYLANLERYMAPTSRIVVVDYRGGHPDAPHGDQPSMQITQSEVTSWMADVGYSLSREIELFDEKFFVEYSR